MNFNNIANMSFNNTNMNNMNMGNVNSYNYNSNCLNSQLNSYSQDYYGGREDFPGIKKRNTTDEEKKKFLIKVEDINSGVDNRTTIMMKNIPNQLTQIDLYRYICNYHQNEFNFFYLPIDFTSRLNVGYVFINFKSSLSIVKFFNCFNSKRIECISSNKLCYISYARIQGFNSIVDHQFMLIKL